MLYEQTFIPIEAIRSIKNEPFAQIFEQSHKIRNIEEIRHREHMAQPYPSKGFDLLAINVPSSYQQGMIPDGEEPPWGMLRVVVSARELFGFNAGILDAHRLKLTPSEIEDQIEKTGAKLIGLNPTSVNVSEAQMIADMCRKMGIPYILGGVHATLDPRIARQDFPDAFAIVRGNGENAIGEVLQVAYDGLSKSEDHGIYYDDKTMSQSSYARKLKPNEIPIVRQDLYVEQPLYSHDVTINGKTRTIDEATLYITDGCPFECTFCSSPVMVNRGNDIPYARPSMKRIVDEVEYVVNLGADAIHFLDDMVLIEGDNIRDFYTGIEQRGLLGKFIWRGLTRAPVVLHPDFNDEVMHMMKDSGSWKIAFGVESGSNEVLKRIKKRVTKEQIIDAVKKLALYDIQVKGFFIMGFPGETEQQIQETFNFISVLKSLGMTEISVFQFKPYPGTGEYFELLKTKPEALQRLGYLRKLHTDLSPRAQERANNHIWLPDDLEIAEVSSGIVREYVTKALEDFYEGSIPQKKRIQRAYI